MLIIPAIDIKNKRCVMLKQGKLDEEKVYSNDPVFVAKHWYSKGAKRIHVVDLDGAFCGVPQNLEIIRDIRKSIDCEIEFGGGVRSVDIVKELVKIGIDKVIISTLFIYNPTVVCEITKKYEDKIIVALDLFDEKLAIAGWKEKLDLDVYEAINMVKKSGVREIIITDIKKDGLLEGVDYELYKKIIWHAQGFKIIISGGISSIDDIKEISKLKPYGLIIGKALYEGLIDLGEAIKLFGD